MYTELELGFTGFLIDFLLAWEAHGGRRLFFSKMDAMERREEGERGERHTPTKVNAIRYLFLQNKNATKNPPPPTTERRKRGRRRNQ